MLHFNNQEFDKLISNQEFDKLISNQISNMFALLFHDKKFFSLRIKNDTNYNQERKVMFPRQN